MRAGWLSGCVLLMWLTGAAQAQEAAQAGARGVTRFALERSGLMLRGPVRPWAQLSSAGQRAAVVGSEDGRLEVWTWPLRLVRDLQLVFRLDGQTEAIAATSIARQVEVRPEGATIVYAHPSFTVRQHVLVPLNEPGALLLLQVESARPLTIQVHLHADFQMFFPGGFGGGSISWQADRRRFLLLQGGVRTYRALLGSPLASDGVAQQVPDVARSGSHFVLEVNPAQSAAEYIPIAIAGGSTVADSVERVYSRLLAQAPGFWRERLVHYRRMQDELSMRTSHTELDRALEWLRVDLDHPLRSLPVSGALVLNALGQYDRLRAELRGLAQRQRSDGSIPSSVPGPRPVQMPGDAQAAPDGDATSFWLLACYQYWSGSGDDTLVRELWPNASRAFRHLTRSSERTADVTRAAVWLAALEAMPALTGVVGDAVLGAEAISLFEGEQRRLESYWRDAAGWYVDRPENNSLTIWPTLAMAFGLLDNARASRMLREVSSSALSSDWGARTLSSYDSLYNPQQDRSGAVLPTASAFAALGHYRYHRAWAGYDLVRDLARATQDFARGHEPAALSGAFYTTLEPALPRQFAATSMLALPAVHGLFGVVVDAPNRALSVEPHLPAEWTTASLQQLRVGRDRVRLDLRRERGKYTITLQRQGGAAPLFVRVAPALPLGTRVERIRVNDSDAPVQVEESAYDVHAVVEVSLVTEAEVEVEYSGGIELYAPPETVEPGDRSQALKVLDFRREGSDFVVLVEGVPGASYTMDLRVESRVRAVLGADLLEHAQEHMQLRVRFAPGLTPFARREVRVRI